MARSLGLAAPNRLVHSTEHDVAYARVGGVWDSSYRALARSEVPACLPSGDRVLFTGWFDNLDEIARRLNLDTRNPALVYGHAVDRWEDEAELHVIGAYAAVVDRPRKGEVRLARSSLSAPPLRVHCSERMVAASSVPRALLALGIPTDLDEDRLAMHLHVSCHDKPGGWYKAIESLQLGVVLSVTRDGERRSRPHDISRVPEVRLGSDGDYLEAAEALLGEAIERTIAGFRQPGTFLTGGLDSSIVASHLLDRLPEGQRLPTFTYVPEPADHGTPPPTLFPDERPYVEAFAAMHPRIETNFFDNAGVNFETGLHDMFLLGGFSLCSAGLFYPFPAMYEAARKRGCDLLIGAGMGNQTFSNDGIRGHVEYFRTGRWRQAWLAAKHRHADPRPVWRRFLSLSVLRSLPLPMWKAMMQLRNGFRPDPSFHLTAGALNPDWPDRANIERAVHAADTSLDRPFHTSREDEIASMVSQRDADMADIQQVFQQRHSIAFRDVTCYRPFVEFCWGLPTDQFLRDGEFRRLARNMGKGRLPEAMRTEPRRGYQHADWHLRMGRRREALLEELREMQGNDQIARLVDLPRLIRLLEDFPETSSSDLSAIYSYMMGVPNGVAMARFIRYVSGTNA